MESIKRLSIVLTRLLRPLKTPFLASTSWLAVVGAAAVCFASGTATHAEEMDFIPFTASFGAAAATSAVVTLLAARRRRLALEIALSITTPVAILAAALYWILELNPAVVRSSMGLWEYLRLLSFFEQLAPPVVTVYGPIGMILGAGVGLLAGAFLRLARGRPRLAGGLAVGLLLAIACGPVLSAGLRLLTDLVVEVRLDHGHVHIARVRGDEIATALGATTGAIVGAIGAWIAARGRNSNAGSRPLGGPIAVAGTSEVFGAPPSTIMAP